MSWLQFSLGEEIILTTFEYWDIGRHKVYLSSSYSQHSLEITNFDVTITSTHGSIIPYTITAVGL